MLPPAIFLGDVWDAQERNGFVCISQKTEGWRDECHEFEPERQVTFLPADLRELYFCPNLFNGPRRKEGRALPSHWLYADLDQSSPESLAIPPTVAWETSPGRYQALWYLTRPIAPQTHRQLNQKLTYFCNADLGGWGLTKVLRVPGSLSVKHGFDFHIEVPEIDWNCEYDPQELWREIRHVPTDQIVIAGKVDVQSTEAARKLMRKVPARLRVQLRRKVVADRSRHVYKLCAWLRESGFDESDTATLLMVSPTLLEKYGARSKEEAQRLVSKVFAKEPRTKPKAKKKTTEKSSTSRDNGTSSGRRIESLNKLMARDVRAPKWLIEGIWSEEAHGVIAGEEKTFKSLIAMDLAVSVASGTKFLNHFPVPETGHVLFIQEENPVGFVKDRFEKILVSRGLSGYASRNGSVKLPPRVPMDTALNTKFDLTSEEDIEWLHETVAHHKSKLLVLDPLYLMTPGLNENSAHDMVPVLSELLRVKQEHECGVLLIHHYKKQDRENPFNAEAARISGTGAFGRWYESLLLIEKGDEPSQVRIVPKHRMEAPTKGLTVDFNMGPMGDPHYDPVVTVPKDEAAEMYATIRDTVEANPGVTVAQMAKDLGMRGERLRRFLDKMVDVVVEEGPGKKASSKIYLA